VVAHLSVRHYASKDISEDINKLNLIIIRTIGFEFKIINTVMMDKEGSKLNRELGISGINKTREHYNRKK